MTRLYIEEMNLDQLKAVFHANSKLREAIREDMMETENDWIREQLDYISDSLSDYSISDYGHSYITVSDYGDFIEGMRSMDNSIPALFDEDLHILEAAEEIYDRYMNTDIDSEAYYEAEKELESVIEELSDVLIHRFKQRYEGCYKEEYQLDYFLDFYCSERIEGAYIIPSEGTYELYIDSTKSFK